MANTTVRKKNNNRKTNDYGTNRSSHLKAPDFHMGLIEFTMSKALADDILQVMKSKKSPQEVLCEYVNDEMGLKGHCVKVLVQG